MQKSLLFETRKFISKIQTKIAEKKMVIAIARAITKIIIKQKPCQFEKH